MEQKVLTGATRQIQQQIKCPQYGGPRVDGTGVQEPCQSGITESGTEDRVFWQKERMQKRPVVGGGAEQGVEKGGARCDFPWYQAPGDFLLTNKVISMKPLVFCFGDPWKKVSEDITD